MSYKITQQDYDTILFLTRLAYYEGVDDIYPEPFDKSSFNGAGSERDSGNHLQCLWISQCDDSYSFYRGSFSCDERAGKGRKAFR